MLSHPLGEEKKRLLSLLNFDYRVAPMKLSNSISALFPEIYLLNDYSQYKTHVIEDFELQLFNKGDQTKHILDDAKKELDGYTSITKNQENQQLATIEESKNRINAALFLASHYFYHSMFPWFWEMFKIAEHTNNSSLYLHAGDIAFFEKRPIDLICNYYHLSISSSSDKGRTQRIWNKIAVVCALDLEFELAENAIGESFQMLNRMPITEEKKCRLAEHYNTYSLINVKKGDHESANHYLNLAFESLGECNSKYHRVPKIQGILDSNSKRLKKISL